MPDTKISALSTGTPLSTSLFAAVINSTTMAVKGSDLVLNAMTAGSLLLGAGGVASSLAIGSSGYLLQSTGGTAAWKSPVRYVAVQVVPSTVTLTVADGLAQLPMPPELAGYNLSFVHAMVNSTSTESTSMLFMIHNLTAAADVLSSGVVIDGGEKASNTASSAYLIDTTEDDVTAYDVYRFDADVVGSSAAKGLVMTLGFSLP